MVRSRLVQPNQHFLVRWILGLYEFSASLKLAVVLIFLTAVVLAVATFVESTCGTEGVQWYIYQTPWFLALLALLAWNIFCAAAIRYPWKRHQTGFVITHIGLLTLLAGAGIQYDGAVNSQLQVFEGQVSRTAIDLDFGYLVASGLPGTKETLHFPLKLGPFSWRDDPPSGWYRRMMTWLGKDDASKPWQHAPVTVYEKDDVRLEVVDYLSRSETVAVPRLDLKFKQPVFGMNDMPPIALTFDKSRGFATKPFMSMGNITFWRVAPELFESFTRCVPTRQVEDQGMVVVWWNGEATDISVARLLEEKKSGKPVELADGVSVELVEYVRNIDLNEFLKGQKFIEGAISPEREPIPAVELKLHVMTPAEEGKEAAKQEFKIFRFASLPFAKYDKNVPKGLGLEFYHPEVKGRVDIVEGPGNQLAYRVWQMKQKRVVAAGLLQPGETVNTWSMGGENNAWQMTLQRYLSESGEVQHLSDEAKTPYEVVPLPFDKNDQTSKITRTVKTRLSWKENGEVKSREQWQLQTLPPPWFSPAAAETVSISLPEGKEVLLSYRAKETPLGFAVRLDDFELKKDAGAGMAANYTSHISLFTGSEEPKPGEKGREFLITMNAPLDYPDPQGRTLRLFQENYQAPERDLPAASVFRVNYDPGRWIKYLGSFLITIGIFMMFYMKAYFFKPKGRALVQGEKKTDGNSDEKRESPRAELSSAF